MGTKHDGRRRRYERFGWIFSGGLLATRPATAVVDALSRFVTRTLTFVAGKSRPRDARDRDDD